MNENSKEPVVEQALDDIESNVSDKKMVIESPSTSKKNISPDPKTNQNNCLFFISKLWEKICNVN